MPRNAKILVHRCFDVSKCEYESAEYDGIVLKKNGFVRFPKPDCTCTERVRFRERDAMLSDGRAIVVLREGAMPSVDPFQWKEIVAVASRKRHKGIHRDRGISALDIYKAYVS